MFEDSLWVELKPWPRSLPADLGNKCIVGDVVNRGEGVHHSLEGCIKYTNERQ